MKYWKLLVDNKHYKTKYHNGLNQNKYGICFASRDILKTLYPAYTHYSEVEIPFKARISIFSNYPEQWKANKVILKEIKPINEAFFREVLEHGVPEGGIREAIRYTIKTNQIKLLKFLLKNKKSKLNDLLTGLFYAVDTNNYRLVKLFLDLGVIDIDGEAISNAVLKGNYKITRLLLKNNSCYATGESIFYAVRANNYKLVKLLLEHGVMGAEGRSLKFAAECGYHKIVKLLCNYQDLFGMFLSYDKSIALIIAARENHYNVVKTLLKNKNTNDRGYDINFKWALNFAIEHRNSKMIKLLKNYKFSIYDKRSCSLNKGIKEVRPPLIKLDEGAERYKS